MLGNNGYPVTHFWVHHMDYIQFESKGHHDHPKPEAKRTSMRKREAQSAKYNVDEIIERVSIEYLVTSPSNMQSFPNCKNFKIYKCTNFKFKTVASVDSG